MGSPTGRSRATGFLLPFATILVIFCVLEAAKRLGLLPIFVPAPSQIAGEAWNNPALVWGSLGPTAWKALLGYGAAATICLVAASLAVTVRILYAPVYNLGVTLQAIPIIATAPLLALWLGTGTTLHVVIAALAAQFPMLVGGMQGLRAADERQRELMHTLSASPSQTLRYLLIPAALPYVFAGLKIAAPSAVLGAVTAEWAGADRGVGAMMLYALFSYDTPKVWLSVVLTCVLAASGYGFWALAERRAIFWDRGVEIAD
jgi:NitT/TauT family transport system permease protein